MGMPAVAEAAVRAAVALAMTRSTPSETKPLTIVPQLLAPAGGVLVFKLHLAGEGFFRAS